MIGKRKKIQGKRVDIPEAIDDNRPFSVDRASRVSIDRRSPSVIDNQHQRAGISFYLVTYALIIYFPPNSG
ncbi:hypothetical protein Bca101_101940 [Brassica carinata]